MKLKLLILFTALLGTLTVHAQWASRAGFPGITRAKSTAFSIGNKIYVLGGVSNTGAVLVDFWEYDIPSNSWTQQLNFPGPERYGAVSFVLNGKGYVATGGNDFGYLDDLWEFDPSTHGWIQRTGLPAGSAQHENQRTESFGFSIGNKGYLGGGEGFVFGANSTTNIAFYDLWEYDPLLNSWQQKADFPDFVGRNMSVAGAINNKGYVGLGCDVWQTTNHQTFWEYDPLTNNWTAKASFPTLFTADAGGFALGSALYVTGGVNLNPIGLSGQLYKYDPVTNTWTLLPAFSGGAIAGEFAVATGSTAFVGTGYNGSIMTRGDLWEFTGSPAGIQNVPEPGSFLYPNPATDKIFIHASMPLARLEVFDMAGKKVLDEKNDNTLTVSNLAPGMYTLRLTRGNNTFYFDRFVKE